MDQHVTSCEGKRQTRKCCLVYEVNDSVRGCLVKVHSQLVVDVRLASPLRAVQ